MADSETQIVDPDQFTEGQLKSIKWVDEFFKNPSDDSLQWLSPASSHLRPHHIHWVLQKYKADPDIFTQFFDRKDERLAHQSKRPGRNARSWLLYAMKAETVDVELTGKELDTLLKSNDNRIKERAAWVKTRYALYTENMKTVESLVQKSTNPVKLGVASGFRWHIIDELKYGVSLKRSIDQSKPQNGSTLRDGDLVTPLDAYVKFLRNGLTEKNKKIKSAYTDSILILFRKTPELYPLFEQECEALIDNSDAALLKFAIKLSVSILKEKPGNQKLINGLVSLNDHKNSNISMESWGAISMPFVCKYLSPEAIKRLAPNIAKPVKNYQGYILSFAEQTLKRDILVDEIKAYAEKGMDSGIYTKHAKASITKMLEDLLDSEETLELYRRSLSIVKSKDASELTEDESALLRNAVDGIRMDLNQGKNADLYFPVIKGFIDEAINFKFSKIGIYTLDCLGLMGSSINNHIDAEEYTHSLMTGKALQKKQAYVALTSMYIHNDNDETEPSISALLEKASDAMKYFIYLSMNLDSLEHGKLLNRMMISRETVREDWFYGKNKRTSREAGKTLTRMLDRAASSADGAIFLYEHALFLKNEAMELGLLDDKRTLENIRGNLQRALRCKSDHAESLDMLSEIEVMLVRAI